MPDIPDVALSAFRLLCFGTFHIEVQGNLLPPIRSQKGEQILAYLAARHGEDVERSIIAEALWPDSLGDTALTNLRQILSDLRRALGSAATCVESPTRDTLFLRLSGSHTDLIVFDQIASKMWQIKHVPDADLEHLVSLYRRPLLEDWTDEWVLEERNRCDGIWQKALNELSRRAVTEQKYEEAKNRLRQLAWRGICDEKPWEDLIQALVTAKKFVVARQCFDELTAHCHRIHETAPTTNRKALFQDVPVPQNPPNRHAIPGLANSKLPHYISGFFGREEELETLQNALVTNRQRLTTLTGPGGAGKTRVAVEAARLLAFHFPNRLWFVPLASLSAPDELFPVLARALGRRPAAGHSRDAVIAFLQAQKAPILLVLDNFEHLVEGGADVVRELLHQAPLLSCLVTSRARLGIAGERLLPLSPLDVPCPAQTPEQLGEISSVRMFVDLARSVKPDFALTTQNAPTVGELCRRLEGIPLALELCAAWAAVLTPAQMVSRLAERFTFLVQTRAAPGDRHRSLQAALLVSYELLRPDLQALFARIAVFRGGWTQDAANAVCDPFATLEGLDHLVDGSLIRSEDLGGEMRFAMLETLREFAGEHLDAPVRAIIQERHAAYYHAFMVEAEERFHSEEQGIWFARVRQEESNVHAALNWFRQTIGLSEEKRRQGFALAMAFIHYGAAGINSTPMQAYLRELLTILPAKERRSREYAQALITVAGFDILSGHHEAAQQAMTRAHQIHQDLGEETGSFVGGLGWCQLEMQNYAEAKALFADASDCCQRTGHKETYARLFNAQAIACYKLGEYKEAHYFAKEGVAHQRALKDMAGILQVLTTLGVCTRALGDHQGSKTAYREAAEIALRLKAGGASVYALEGWAYLKATTGGYRNAASLLGSAAALRQSMACPKPESERSDYERYVALAKAHLSADEFETAWAEGSRRSWNHALEFALSTEDVEK